MKHSSDALATDLYQLTMAAAYFENHLHQETAIFEMFVRKMPGNRNYLLAAGLDQALEYLENLTFTDVDIDYIRKHPSFTNVSEEFFSYLKEFRFTGDVWAMPEGTPFFALEPILRVEAPIIEAQIIETYLLATINFQSMIASKAARMVQAARGREIIEFGTRRAHGPEAGLLAARAAFLAGCVGTSNVKAGYRFGIPTFGTLAHSFIMTFDEEAEAFAAFLKTFPETATILVDTFDSLEAVKTLVSKFKTKIPAIRLDSGDLLTLSIEARDILDRAGRQETKIVASNDLNEYLIASLLADGAKIDAFGVGTQLATSFDAPALSGVYKLVGLRRNGSLILRMKHSPEKASFPGAKQVWRNLGGENTYKEDLLALHDEEQPKEGVWAALLTQVMKKGKRLDAELVIEDDQISGMGEEKSLQGSNLSTLNRIRARVKSETMLLPDELLSLERGVTFPVRISKTLLDEQERLRSFGP